jgi:YHS domain-containing protein
MKTCEVVIPRIGMSFLILALAIVLSGGVFGGPKGPSKQPKTRTLVQVEAKYVCMINNQRFPKKQIPIEVENRTYYGCCEMCKAKLRNDPESRTAIDPVSGKKVDKATAIIGASSDGKVFYFENLENLKRFKAGSNSSDRK